MGYVEMLKINYKNISIIIKDFSINGSFEPLIILIVA